MKASIHGKSNGVDCLSLESGVTLGHGRIVKLPSSLLICYSMLLVSGWAQTPYATIDLNDLATNGSKFSRYFGSTGTGDSGVPVCGGFDCDADGFPDTGFAQIKGDPLGRTNAGEVTLVFGDGTIGNRQRDTAGFETDILKIAGEQAHEIAGAEIWMEDFNGDGFGDLMIGRQNHTFDGRIGAGALTIIFGGPKLREWAANLAYLDLGNLPVDQGNGILTIYGAATGDRLGIWMRGGDVDGDGTADIVVGADQIADGAVTHRGGVYVIRGGTELTALGGELDLADFGTAMFPVAMHSRVALVLPPVEAGEDFHFGGTVNVGDLDGNGRAEVIAGAALNRAGAALGPNGSTSHSSGGPIDGTVFIAWDENFPTADWPNGYTFSVTAPLLGDYTRINGPAISRTFGEELLAGEDYSGDGFADLFVGDLTGDPPGLLFGGLGFVIYNASKLRGRDFDMDALPADIAITTIYGPIERAIGADTMAHGDFDNDGITDLACGNPHDAPQGRVDAGSVHVFYGQPGGWPALIDLAPNQLPSSQDMRIVQIDGAFAGDVLCYSASVGYLDGDDHADFIVNEMRGNGPGGVPEDVGNLVIVSGAAMGSAPAHDLYFDIPLVDFGVVELGSTTDRSFLIKSLASSNPISYTLAPSLIGPEIGDFSIESLADAPGYTVVILRFTPTALGPHGAALVAKTATDVIPARLGLRAIVVDPAATVDCELVPFADKNLLRFTTELGREYDSRRSPSLPANWWPWMKDLPGTGGRVLVEDRQEASQVRQFYQVVGQ